MKWQTTPQFEADWERLPAEHRRAFRDVVPAFAKACDAYVARRGAQRWPAAPRVKPLTSAPGVWGMTWSFAGPDGRATFQFLTGEGEPAVLWRRIGTHTIYSRP